MDISYFATKTNLVCLKTKVDKIDIDKLKTVPVDLAKLSNFVKNDVVKKAEYNKLLTKVDYIDTTDFVKETKYEKNGSDFEDKISKIDKKVPDISSLVKKTDFNSKISEVENEIPNVSGFLLISVFKSKISEVENKIPDIKNLASKTEVTAVENKTTDVTDLVTKTDYVNETTKIKNNYVTNAALDARHDLERDASYFRGKNYFGDDGMQNDLDFQVSQKIFDSTWDGKSFWRSKGFFNQYLFFNHTNVNIVSIKKYPGKPADVRFSTDFFLYQKDKIF